MPSSTRPAVFPLGRAHPVRAGMLRSASLAASLALLASPSAWASSPPLWEVGALAVAVSQQAYPGSDQQVRRALAVPYAIYRGRVLRADQDTAGLRAWRSERWELDLGVAGAFAARSQDIDARRGMRDLGTLVEFGPRVRVKLGSDPKASAWRLDLPLRGVFDLDDGAAHRGMAFEPELSWQQRTASGLSWSASIGAIVADQRLARTFYAVDAADVAPGRAAYAASAGLVAWRLSGSVSQPLGTDWRVFGFARLDSLNGAANRDSPLVRRTTGLTAGVGLSYTWLRSVRPARE